MRIFCPFKIPLNSKNLAWVYDASTALKCFELGLIQFLLCILARFLCVRLLSVSAISAVRLDYTSDTLVFLCFCFFAALTVILLTCMYLTSTCGLLHISHWVYIKTLTSRCQMNTQQVHTWPPRTCRFVCNCMCCFNAV